MSNRLMRVALPVIAAGTVILLAAYAAVQQDLRQSANDPQIELAEDAAALLSGGYPPDALVAAGAKTDMSRSLAPFVMVFDSSGKLVASSAVNVPASPSVATGAAAAPSLPPSGVFDSVHKNGEDRLTWQTSGGQRFAAVIAPWKMASSSSGFVLAARSLREVEIRESHVSWIFFGGWVAMVIVTIAVVLGGSWLEERKRR